MAWLTGYNCRKKLTVTGTADGAQSDYQFSLHIDKNVGSDSGNVVSLEALCANWPYDIRFTKDDGETTLKFWRQEYDTTDGTWWVKLGDGTNIPASPDTIDYYIYWNNPSVTDDTGGSSGVDTWVFFESFDSLNTGDLSGQNGWDGDAEADVQTSVYKEGSKAASVSGSDKQCTQDSITFPQATMKVLFYIQATAATGSFNGDVRIMEGTGSFMTNVGINGNCAIQHLYSGGWENVCSASFSTWYHVMIAIDSASTHKIWVDGVLKSLTHNSNYNNVSVKPDTLRITHYSGSSTGYFDTIAAGNYTPNEPTISAWGILEALQTVGGSITPTASCLKGLFLSLSGTVTSGGTAQKMTSKNLLEGVLDSAGVLAKIPSKIVGGTVTLAGSLVKTISKYLSGAVSSSSSVIKTTYKNFSGTLSSSGSILRGRFSLLSGILGLSGALNKMTSLTNLSGTLTFSGVLEKIIPILIESYLTLSSTLSKLTYKNVGGVLSSSSTALKGLYQAVGQGYLVITGAFSKGYFVSVSGILTFTGALVATVRRTLHTLLYHKQYRTVKLSFRSYRTIKLFIRGG